MDQIISNLKQQFSDAPFLLIEPDNGSITISFNLADPTTANFIKSNNTKNIPVVHLSITKDNHFDIVTMSKTVTVGVSTDGSASITATDPKDQDPTEFIMNKAHDVSPNGFNSVALYSMDTSPKPEGTFATPEAAVEFYLSKMGNIQAQVNKVLLTAGYKPTPTVSKNVKIFVITIAVIIIAVVAYTATLK